MSGHFVARNLVTTTSHNSVLHECCPNMFVPMFVPLWLEDQKKQIEIIPSFLPSYPFFPSFLASFLASWFCFFLILTVFFFCFFFFSDPYLFFWYLSPCSLPQFSYSNPKDRQVHNIFQTLWNITFLSFRGLYIMLYHGYSMVLPWWFLPFPTSLSCVRLRRSICWVSSKCCSSSCSTAPKPCTSTWKSLGNSVGLVLLGKFRGKFGGKPWCFSPQELSNMMFAFEC